MIEISNTLVAILSAAFYGTVYVYRDIDRITFSTDIQMPQEGTSVKKLVIYDIAADVYSLQQGTEEQRKALQNMVEKNMFDSETEIIIQELNNLRKNSLYFNQ